MSGPYFFAAHVLVDVTELQVWKAGMVELMPPLLVQLLTVYRKQPRQANNNSQLFTAGQVTDCIQRGQPARRQGGHSLHRLPQ